MKKYAGEEFLNRLYKDLIHSSEVMHTATGRNKNEDLAIYFERLDRINKRALKYDKLTLLKKFYYDKYLIKAENIPEAHYKLQEKILLENGYGHINYVDEEKQKEADYIIKEQKASLDNWLNYFLSEETNYYPMWFKYFVFQNIIKIGEFDKSKKEFTKRTNSTVKPFLELNKEAVALLYDELSKYLNKEEIDDKTLESLIKNGSFFKIFGYITLKLDNVKKGHIDVNDGVWRKYKKGSNPNILADALSGKGTGWCTAGKETAKFHLEYGDFYIYFTLDNEGNYTIPRIAIRMSGDEIAEIRGVAAEQKIEPGFENVLEKKLNEFPDKDHYKKKEKDMALLTTIYKKNQENKELSREEIRFLYEIEDKIIGFGCLHDPRIREIINSRDVKKDLSLALDLKEYQISTTKEEVKMGLSEYHYGNLILDAEESKTIHLPKEVRGFYAILNGNNPTGFKLPSRTERIIIGSLECAKGVVFPEGVEILELSGLISAEGLVLSESLLNTSLPSLISPEGIMLPKDENGSFYVPGNIDCPFSNEELIEAAKRTEANQLHPRIFESVDNLDLNSPKR